MPRSSKGRRPRSASRARSRGPDRACARCSRCPRARGWGRAARFSSERRCRARPEARRLRIDTPPESAARNAIRLAGQPARFEAIEQREEVAAADMEVPPHDGDAVSGRRRRGRASGHQHDRPERAAVAIEGLSFADVRPRAPGHALRRWAPVAVDHVRTRARWRDSRIRRNRRRSLGPQRHGTGSQQQKRQRAATDAKRSGWPHDANGRRRLEATMTSAPNAIRAAALTAIPTRRLAGS